MPGREESIVPVENDGCLAWGCWSWGFPRCGLGLGPFGFGHFKGLGFKRYNRTGTISGYSYKLLLGLGIVGLGTAPSKLRA